MLKQDIFGALDNVVHLTDPASKVIISSIENIIYNIAQMDFGNWAAYATEQISQRLTQGDERYQASGLRALKSIFQAFELSIGAERINLNNLVDHFFPLLEQFMGQASFQQSENYTHMMILIAKIFFISVQVSIAFCSFRAFLRELKRVIFWRFFEIPLELRTPIYLLFPLSLKLLTC